MNPHPTGQWFRCSRHFDRAKQEWLLAPTTGSTDALLKAAGDLVAAGERMAHELNRRIQEEHE